MKTVREGQSPCSVCGNPAPRSIEDRPFTESGLSDVTLKQIEVIHCEHCGNEEVIIPKIHALMRTLALAVVSKPYPLRGEEIRFLRKYLEMTQVAFARLIGIDHTNLSKWENNREKPGEQSDRLIRMFLLTLGNLGAGEKLQETVKGFEAIHEGGPGKTMIDPEHLTYELLGA